jgi:hypothetical protein
VTTQSENCRPSSSTSRKYWKPVLLLAPLVAFVGCSGGPARILPPHIDADDSAERAMEMYDTDGDGLLSAAELEAVPGLKAAMETLDADKDGKASELEIAERIRFWQVSQGGVTSIRCRVTMDGKPLVGATVTFEPESFLGEAIQTAVGVTNFTGAAGPSIPKENRPIADMPPGIQLGTYRVRISKLVEGEETVPAKYNAETTLGQQVSTDDPAIVGRRVIFKLQSR